MTAPARPLLAVFFSHGISLAQWIASGLAPKELSYYRALEKRFGDVTFITYDTPSPETPAHVASLAPMSAVINRWRLPYQLFGVLAPLLHFRALRRATILKTNQLNGAWTAVLAKWLLRKPLVVRCGFVPSVDALRDPRAGRSRLRIRLAMLVEKLCVRAGDLVFAATPSDIRYLIATHGVDAARTRHVPTPIDTQRFVPLPGVERDEKLVITIVRLVADKNVGLLIEACQSLPGVKLRVIGTGPLEAELRAKSDPSRVTFLGALPNDQLPRQLADASVYVLPSDYEGSPKALLEAMSAGLAVVGTRVYGTRDVIEHGRTGLLADVNAQSIAQSIDTLLRDRELRARLGAAAREFVVRGYTLEDVADREAAYLSTLVR